LELIRDTLMDLFGIGPALETNEISGIEVWTFLTVRLARIRTVSGGATVRADPVAFMFAVLRTGLPISAGGRGSSPL
jgi:hypothetical protein